MDNDSLISAGNELVKGHPDQCVKIWQRSSFWLLSPLIHSFKSGKIKKDSDHGLFHPTANFDRNTL